MQHEIEQRRSDEENNNKREVPSDGSGGGVPSPSNSSYVGGTNKPNRPDSVVYYRGDEHPTTVTAIEVRRQKEAELRQNDAYWTKRMAQLEHTLQKTNAILERECTAAVNLFSYITLILLIYNFGEKPLNQPPIKGFRLDVTLTRGTKTSHFYMRDGAR